MDALNFNIRGFPTFVLVKNSKDKEQVKMHDHERSLGGFNDFLKENGIELWKKEKKKNLFKMKND